MNEKHMRGSWILPDCQQFVANFFLSQQIDEPLELLLRKVFGQVLGKLMFYTGSAHGIHIFANALPQQMELHYLLMGSETTKYRETTLFLRNGKSETSCDDRELPAYRRIAVDGFPNRSGVDNAIRKLLEAIRPFVPHRAPATDWADLLAWIGQQHDKHVSLAMPQQFPSLSRGDGSVFVVPLSPVTDKLPLGSLGVMILWGSAAGHAAQETELREGLLRPVTKLLSASVLRFLKVHYHVSEETYLPAYRCAGTKNIAILFADIRNFTPTTEILRNFNLVPELTEFMHSYCFEMGNIVKAHGGRVQSYAGDGIMALFGEYMINAQESVRSATTAAVEMCSKFQQIKEAFLAKPRLQQFLSVEYEPIDLNLGIGINFGQVIFDYFGPPDARVFSPLGDHVNFAQRLETEAFRFDPALGRKRSATLLSRPAWVALGRPADFAAVSVQAKGKPFTYEVYECPSGFKG